MADVVLIPLPAVGTLELPREVYERYLRPVGANAAPQAPDSEPLLTAGEMAKALGLPKCTVYEKARTGEFPCVRVGKHVRFHRAHVLAALRPTASGATGRA